VTVLRVDHTAIAVRDLDEAIDRYERLYGIAVTERVRVVDQNVEVAFLTRDGTSIELVSPLEGTSGVAGFLAKRGEGLHHIGLAVDDIQQELDRLARQGVELIDRAPRPGVHGRIAFCHPRGTGGVLVELVETDERDTG
jgi:methylmalonyl-CoA/ethylmalonyl-CoA epimerase